MKWMALVHLSSKKPVLERHNFFFYCLALVSSLLLSSKSLAQSQEFTTFADAKAYLLNQISAAKSSVGVYTEFLTDGEIVSSLYLAKFRKIDTNVLLHPGQANHFLSRLRDLKKEDIKVFFAPRDFPRQAKSALIIDQTRVFFFDAALDYQTRGQRFIVKEVKDRDAETFRTAFAKGLGESIEPKNIWTLPRVGRGRPSSSPPAANNRSVLPAQRYQSNHPEAQGAYRYETNRGAGIPSYIQRQLPKETIWQMKQRNAEIRQAPAVNPPATGPATKADDQRLPNDWQPEPATPVDAK